MAGNGDKAGSLALIQSVFTIAFFTSTTSGSTYRDVVSGNDIQSSSLASDIRRHGASLHWPLLSPHTEVARTYEAEELFFDREVGQHALAAQEVLQEARFQHSQSGKFASKRVATSSLSGGKFLKIAPSAPCRASSRPGSPSQRNVDRGAKPRPRFVIFSGLGSGPWWSESHTDCSKQTGLSG